MKRTIKKSSLRSFINQAAFLPCSQANGPGKRAVVWVQGCYLRCPGCFNPGMQALKRHTLISPEVLSKRIAKLENIEGVTFSGGEPFLQAAALACLAEKIANHGLNTVIFTGYTWEELKNSADPSRRRLLAAADLLVTGPYLKDRPSGRYLCASDNQELVFLSDRLKNHPDITNDNSRLTEFIIDHKGNIITTGLVPSQ